MKVFVFALLVAAVAAYEPAYPQPSYPAPPAPAPSAAKSDYPPMPYNLAWAVKDDPTYNDFAHEAAADDKGFVTGSYRVLLPDTRVQIVNFKADGTNGYVADVKYEGEAKYPEEKASAPPKY